MFGSIRPERIEAHFEAAPPGANVLQATVNDVIYFGDHLRLRCTLPDETEAKVRMALTSNRQPEAGKPVWLRFPNPHLRIYT